MTVRMPCDRPARFKLLFRKGQSDHAFVCREHLRLMVEALLGTHAGVHIQAVALAQEPCEWQVE